MFCVLAWIAVLNIVIKLLQKLSSYLENNISDVNVYLQMLIDLFLFSVFTQ